MNTIKIGKREIPLFYSTKELIDIQREIGCTGFELKDKVFGLRQVDEDNPESIVLDVVTDPERMEKLGKLIMILGNAGLEEDGQEPDLTLKWVLRNIRPAMIAIYAVTVMAVIIQGNQMEQKEEENSGPVDMILEEENAKKQPGN